MADFYFPSNKTVQKINDLVLSFYLEKDEKGELVLLLKFEASVITSLIKGCQFELILRSPKISPRTITLYVHDHLESPLWVTWKEFSQQDKVYDGIDTIAIELLKTNSLRVVYFNEMNIPIFTKVLEKRNQFADFENWHHLVVNSKSIIERVYDGYFLPEDTTKGFTVKILNKDYSKEDKLKISSYTENINWGEKPINDNEFYNFNDFLENGKHGYNQELSIRATLSRYFTPQKELFHSVKKTDKTELTDFLVEYRNGVIIIESKYIISDTQRQLNSALVKATNQLNSAEKVIFTNPDLIKNSELANRLKKCEFVIRICLHNDNIIIDEKNTRNLVKKYTKENLPLFISVATFSQMLGTIILLNKENYKYNIFQNLLNLYDNYIDSNEKIFVIRHLQTFL